MIPELVRGSYEFAEEILPEDIFLLPGTGFDVPLEGRRIMREFNELIGAKTYEQIAEYVSRSTLESMTKFWEEYLKRRAVLGISVDRYLLDGEVRMVLRRNGKPWMSIFNGESALVQEAAKKIEEKVVKAKPGSATILISPKRDELPESQIYVYYVDAVGKLDCSTIRVERTTSQIEDFVEAIDSTYTRLDPEKHTERQRIDHLMSWVPHLEGDAEHDWSVPYIIEKLREVHPDLKYLFEQKTFEQVYGDFEVKNVYSLDEDCQTCLLKFQRYIESFFEQNAERFKAGIPHLGALFYLQIAMGKTILDMAAIMRQRRKGNASSQSPKQKQINYREELEHLQELEGCVPIFGQETVDRVFCPYCQEYVYVKVGGVCKCGHARPRSAC